MQAILVLMALTATAAVGPEDAPPAWLTSKHPSDVAKSHVEEISEAPHRFTVRQGGTMDGTNCRSPMGCGIAREGALVQTWESNRSVRMENVGPADLVNPWLSNGRNRFRNVDEIVASAIAPGMTDAEKAFAIWFQEIRYRHHSPGDNNELGDAVKVFNVYGYNTCGNDSICMAALWSKAGLRRCLLGLSAIASPRLSMMATGISMMATCTPCICCATTARWPVNRRSCRTTT